MWKYWSRRPFHILSFTGVNLQSKTYHFLLPAGGAMNLYEYGHLDLFRSGVLPNMWSLVQIGHCMFKLV